MSAMRLALKDVSNDLRVATIGIDFAELTYTSTFFISRLFNLKSLALKLVKTCWRLKPSRRRPFMLARNSLSTMALTSSKARFKGSISFLIRFTSP